MIGILLSFVLMGTRMASLVLTKKMASENRSLVNAIFARGLAAAAIAQLAMNAGIPNAAFIAKIVYVTITGTIILSSIRVFLIKRKMPSTSDEEKLSNPLKRHKISVAGVKK